MKELKDKAVMTYTELYYGDWILDVAIKGWSPLNVEANDETAEPLIVDLLGVHNPEVDHGSGGGHQCSDGGLQPDLNVVEVGIAENQRQFTCFAVLGLWFGF